MRKGILYLNSGLRLILCNRIVLFIVLLVALSPKAIGKGLRHIEKVYYLTGKVGVREVGIKIECYDETPTRYLTYFFLDAKKDQQLVGNPKDESWYFVPDEKDPTPAVTIHIAEQANSTWTGTWKDNTGKIWALTLKPIQANGHASAYHPLPFVVEQDPYERYRLSNIHFTKVKTEAPAKGILCDWYKEQESGISLFRLRSEDKRLNTDSINLELETIHLSLLQKYYKINPKIIDSKFETSLYYLNSEVLSFSISATKTLQTLKKVQTSESVTLDIKNGLRVKLEDILWFDHENPKPASDDQYKIYKYRKSTFAPKVYQLLQELYPDNLKSNSCNMNQPDSWVMPVWNLTSKGISFRLNTADDCPAFDWAIIPYKILKPYLVGKYSLK